MSFIHSSIGSDHNESLLSTTLLNARPLARSDNAPAVLSRPRLEKPFLDIIYLESGGTEIVEIYIEPDGGLDIEDPPPSSPDDEPSSP